MHKKFLKFLLLGVFSLSLGAGFVGCKDYDDDIDDLNNKYEELVTSLDALKAKVDGLVKSVTYDQATGKLTVTPVTGNAVVYQLATGGASVDVKLENNTLYMKTGSGNWEPKGSIDLSSLDIELKNNTLYVDGVAAGAVDFTGQGSGSDYSFAIDPATGNINITKDGVAYQTVQVKYTFATDANGNLLVYLNGTLVQTLPLGLPTYTILFNYDTAGNITSVSIKDKDGKTAILSYSGGGAVNAIITHVELMPSTAGLLTDVIYDILGVIPAQIISEAGIQLPQGNSLWKNYFVGFGATSAAIDYTFGEGFPGALTFVEGQRIPSPKDATMIVKFTPSNITPTASQIKFVRSDGNLDINQLITVTKVEKFSELITRAAADNGLWKVTFRLNDAATVDQFNALATAPQNFVNLISPYTDLDAIPSQIYSYIPECYLWRKYMFSISYQNIDGGFANSVYDVGLYAEERVPVYNWQDFMPLGGGELDHLIALNNDINFSVDGTYYRNFRNRFYSAEDGTMIPEKYIEQMWGNATGTYEVDVEGNYITAIDEIDNRQFDEFDYDYDEFFYFHAEVGKPFTINLNNPEMVYAWYVEFDANHAVESAPSELNAWKSYNVTGLNQVKKANETITINIPDTRAKGDIIGFRVQVVNFDGTLVDPDGKAFYAKVADAALTANYNFTIKAQEYVDYGNWLSSDTLAFTFDPTKLNITNVDHAVLDLPVERGEYAYIDFLEADGTYVDWIDGDKTVTYLDLEDVTRADVWAEPMYMKENKVYTGSLKLYDVDGIMLLNATVTLTKKHPLAFPYKIAFVTNAEVDNNVIVYPTRQYSGTAITTAYDDATYEFLNSFYGGATTATAQMYPYYDEYITLEAKAIYDPIDQLVVTNGAGAGTNYQDAKQYNYITLLDDGKTYQGTTYDVANNIITKPSPVIFQQLIGNKANAYNAAKSYPQPFNVEYNYGYYMYYTGLGTIPTYMQPWRAQNFNFSFNSYVADTKFVWQKVGSNEYPKAIALPYWGETQQSQYGPKIVTIALDNQTPDTFGAIRGTSPTNNFVALKPKYGTAQSAGTTIAAVDRYWDLILRVYTLNDDNTPNGHIDEFYTAKIVNVEDTAGSGTYALNKVAIQFTSTGFNSPITKNTKVQVVGVFTDEFGLIQLVPVTGGTGDLVVTIP